MNITQFIQACRGYLDDPNGNKYPDDVIVRNHDLQANAMFRELTFASQDYHNLLINLQSTDGVQLFQNTFQWTLPRWVHRITKAFVRSGTDSTATTVSAYRFLSPGSLQLGREIPKSDARVRDGWTWDGNSTFTVWGAPAVQTYTLQVAKVPAPAYKAKVQTINTNLQQMFLSNTPLLGEMENEAGSYINAEFTCTATVSLTGTNLGAIRRCIDSNAADIATGTRQHLVYFDRAWPQQIAQNDTIETMAPFPTALEQYHILRTVQATASKKANLDLQRAIATELATEAVGFKNFASPSRDNKGPTFFKSNVRSRISPRDPNRTIDWPGQIN